MLQFLGSSIEIIWAGRSSYNSDFERKDLEKYRL